MRLSAGVSSGTSPLIAATSFRALDDPNATRGAERTIERAPSLPADDPERYELVNSSWYIINRVAQRTQDHDPRESIAGLAASYQALRDLLGVEHPRTFPGLANLGFATADRDACEGMGVLGTYVSLLERERLRVCLPNDR